jgi:hypothetical protein
MSQHQIVLNWVASTDMPSPIPAGDGYNIFRGIEPSQPGATPINATPVTATTYTDTNVTAGTNYDYFVTAVIGGIQSTDSNTVSATVPLFPPTGLVAVAS